MADAAALLAEHASLPEPRQPAWGLRARHGAAEGACDERLAVLLPLLQALPHIDTLRILDLGCAQGYFTLGLAHALTAQGCAVEIVGVDRNEDNIRFCEALAAHHGIPARFVRATFGTDFIRRQEAPGWDVVLALDAAGLVGDAEGVPGEVVSLLRDSSRIVLCEFSEPPRPAELAAARSALDQPMLATRAFRRRIASFPDRGGAMRTLHVCSDSMAWVGGRWFAFDRVADRSHAGIPDAFAQQRRFFLGAHAMVKGFRGDGRYGDFNRKELAVEAEVLHALQGEPGRYPELLARADDGDVVWLARGMLPGQLLSERIAAGDIDRDALALGLLDELAHLESLGFNHGDLRCWNCLVNGSALRLIDFGALVREASPLHRLALSAVLLELASGEPRHEQPFYASVHPVEAYPPTWRPLVCYLRGMPKVAFSYGEALRVLTASLAETSNGSAAAIKGFELDGEILSSAAREHCEVFRRQREHGEALERALDGEERARAAGLAEVSGLRARVRELERARQVSEQEHVRYADSLQAELENSRVYATSLEARFEREAADARIEREAMTAAHRAAVEYSDSLKQSLDRAVEYSDSLKQSLDRSQAYASSLEVRLEQEAGWQARYARMQRRFRLLKFLWPREPDDPNGRL